VHAHSLKEDAHAQSEPLPESRGWIAYTPRVSARELGRISLESRLSCCFEFSQSAPSACLQGDAEGGSKAALTTIATKRVEDESSIHTRIDLTAAKKPHDNRAAHTKKAGL
jgi:hypothetical protein